MGIDVGTASTKGALTTETGELVATAERRHAVSMPRPGWFEQDGELWWNEVAGIARELLESQPATELAAVCVSGIGPCVLLADAAGKPVRPAILYGIDTRAEAEIGELEAELGSDEILSRCGSPLTSQAVGPKLRWVRRHEPEAADAARLLLMPSSLAVLRLTGEYVLDHHSASQCTPMYNIADAAWDDDWAGMVAPDLELPRLLWPAEIAGTVSPAASEHTGIPAGTPVATGTIDAWAEAVSVGVRASGDMMLMYGSTMFLIVLTDHPSPDPHLWLTQWAFPGRRSRAAGLATSGSVTEWFAELTSVPVAELALEAEAVPAGAAGLIALPYFAGERTPLFDPHARGVIAGLQLGHGRAEIFRALLEATGYAVRHNLEAMTAAGDSIDRIVAVGGGTRLPLWTQVVSDITGIEQALPRYTLGASYGDALLGAIAAGLATEATDWNPVERIVEPDLKRHDGYQSQYALYRRLYSETLTSVHELAMLQHAQAEASDG